jgi:fatty-acyl-CoA synthase
VYEVSHVTFDLAALRAALTPENPAVWFRDRWYTCAEMNRRAERLASRLAEQGVGKGDRVGILALNHLAHLDLLLAAPKLGFIYTPFNYRLSAAEQKPLADELAPILLFFDARHQAQAQATARPLLPLADYDNWLAPAGRAPPAPALGPDDLHMLLCTGGSTGTPKAAMLPYRQTLTNAANTALAWSLSAGHCVIQSTPCFHAALNAFTTPLLWLGGRVVLMESFEPGLYLELSERCGATQWFMVPTMFQMLAEHPRFASADLSHVQWAISGGAPCPTRLAELYRARGIRFRQGYGMTEAGVNCFAISPDDAERHPGAVGRPMPGLDAVIRHPDGSGCAPGETGELTLRGPTVCAGYYGRPRETAESFRDGWLWTGDLARQDERGLYSIVGRRKEMFISGGENVYPAEIESALYQLDEIAECAVLGVTDPRWGEVGLAAVALRPGAKPDAESLKQRLREKLAAYKLPRAFLFLGALPKTGAGKIDKPALRRLYLGTPSTESA